MKWARLGSKTDFLLKNLSGTTVLRGCGHQQPLILESEWWAVRHWSYAASNNYYQNGFGRKNALMGGEMCL